MIERGEAAMVRKGLSDEVLVSRDLKEVKGRPCIFLEEKSCSYCNAKALR